MARRAITHRKALQYAKALAAHERASLKNPRKADPWGVTFQRVTGRPLSLGFAIRYINASGKVVTEDVVAEDGRDYVTASGKIVSPTRVREVLKNPPTRKAQAFIGRKIRRLAHEGMRAPRRVAAAYSLARRAGFKVPKRARKNPKGVSEREAWNKVRAHAERILERKVSRTIEDHAEAVRQWATMMLSQLDEGVHENPTLAVLGNPPAKVVGTLSHRLYELRYKHAADGKDYRHPFGPGASVKLLADGSVWICARHRLWEDH